ncbi:MAG: 50S ribosomal protein L5 [Patescibacteria group bacterium]
MSFISLKQKIVKARPELKTKLGAKNALALPNLVKVVINSGTGRARDKKRNELVADRLAKITGQKASARGAKKSIASFKLREGEVIGFASTLRGKRMYDFLDRLLNIAIPRIRDFKGYDRKSIDEIGNLTIGLKEHNVFSETADEEIKDVFGLSVTIVTTAKNRAQAEAFFEAVGFPFKKVKRA